MSPATTAEQRIDELRHAHTRAAVGLLVAGRRADALATVLVSVETQARLAGCGVVDLIDPPPPGVAA